MGKHPAALIALSEDLRAKIEADIEHLIALLDALDGDPDFEPSIQSWGGPGWLATSTVDLEADGSDDEPSLGWPIPDAVPILGYAGSGPDDEVWG